MTDNEKKDDVQTPPSQEAGAKPDRTPYFIKTGRSTGRDNWNPNERNQKPEQTEPKPAETTKPEATPTTYAERKIRYQANGEEYEYEVPEGMELKSDKAIAELKDKLSGWRGKRKEKGENDPGLIQKAVEEGIRAGIESTRPTPEPEDLNEVKLLLKSNYEKFKESHDGRNKC
jgi:hypothetical protein